MSLPRSEKPMFLNLMGLVEVDYGFGDCSMSAF